MTDMRTDIPWWDRQRLKLLGMHAAAQALLVGGVSFLLVAIILLPVSLLSYSGESSLAQPLIVALAIAIFAAVVAAVSAVFGLRQQLRVTEERIGQKLTPDDMIALNLWVRYGVKPAANRFNKKTLKKYLDHVEGQVNGSDLPLSRGMRFALCGIMAFQVINKTADIVAQRGYVAFNVIVLLCALGALILYVPTKPGKPNPLYVRLSSKQLRRIDDRRKQLQN